ncbi:MAG TPA: universal stress protein [Thermoleophilaceae bacterium]|jgi:nucleotide-binding universal stress UspA family protein|nr:universal stress protein [Thermoleophilaceae bacterium]
MSTEPAPPRKLGELQYRHLLVAVDGSPNAELALAAAVTAALRDNAAITLICVAPDVVAETSRFPWPAQIAPADQEQADHYAEQILHDAIELIPDAIPVTRVVRRGRAGQQIVAHAQESNYDAILLGARGLSRMGALLGSVSQHVMHHAPVVVFVAHAPPQDEVTAPEPE